MTASIRLQERDLDTLLSLSTGRYLSVAALEWLHYPEWRERYKAHLEKRKTDPTALYQPTPNLYRRLAAMRDDPALVRRITRTVERARVVYNRLPDVYVLAESGAEVLAARRGYEMDQLWFEDPRRRSIKNLEHSAAIGTCYAALRAALEHNGKKMLDWRGDHQLAGRDAAGGLAYDRVAVAGTREMLAVVPDATFTIDDQRYFLEVDMGTTNLRSWAEKVRAYENYRASAMLQQRYGVNTFVVLVVAPTEPRLKRIAEEVAKVVRTAPNAYLFTTVDKIHPTTIRPGWRTVQHVEWQRRQIVNRLVEMPSAITMAKTPLYTLP